MAACTAYSLALLSTCNPGVAVFASAGEKLDQYHIHVGVPLQPYEHITRNARANLADGR